MKTEKIFWYIFIGSFILRLLNIPGHGLLTVLDLSLLSLLYFPVGFYFFCDKKIQTQNIALSIVSGLFLSIIPIGIMFKLQHYQGKDIFMIMGLASGVIFFIITYFLRKKSSDELRVYYKNMFLRTLVLSIAVLFFILLPTKVIFQIQYRNDPQTLILLTKINDNQDNEQYRKDLIKYEAQQGIVSSGNIKTNNSGTSTDFRDGKTYKTITIGTQTSMNYMVTSNLQGNFYKLD